MYRMRDKAVDRKKAILVYLKYNNNRASSRQLLDAINVSETALAQILDELRIEGKIKTEFRNGKVEVIRNE